MVQQGQDDVSMAQGPAGSPQQGAEQAFEAVGVEVVGAVQQMEQGEAEVARVAGRARCNGPTGSRRRHHGTGPSGVSSIAGCRASF